jgi:hypothetical protein
MALDPGAGGPGFDRLGPGGGDCALPVEPNGNNVPQLEE